jgi:hypothetical protein
MVVAKDNLEREHQKSFTFIVAVVVAEHFSGFNYLLIAHVHIFDILQSLPSDNTLKLRWATTRSGVLCLDVITS